jgi:hypothetical protein
VFVADVVIVIAPALTTASPPYASGTPATVQAAIPAPRTPPAGLTASATSVVLAVNGITDTYAPTGRLVTVPAVAKTAGADAPPAGVAPTVIVVTVAVQTVVTTPIRLVMSTGPPLMVKMD